MNDYKHTNGQISLQRLTPDVDCVADSVQSHSVFVTADSSWLNAKGHWVFDACVELGPSELHGREDFWFDGATMSFDMVHFSSSGCQGPSEVRSRSFEMLRVDKSTAVLDGRSVISNRLLFRDGQSGEQVKQILYFDNSVTPGIMKQGVSDGELDEEGFPSELNNLLFFRQP